MYSTGFARHSNRILIEPSLSFPQQFQVRGDGRTFARDITVTGVLDADFSEVGGLTVDTDGLTILDGGLQVRCFKSWLSCNASMMKCLGDSDLNRLCPAIM